MKGTKVLTSAQGFSYSYSYTHAGGVRQAFVVANYHMTILHSSLHKYIHIVHELHCILRYICIYT